MSFFFILYIFPIFFSISPPNSALFFLFFFFLFSIHNSIHTYIYTIPIYTTYILAKQVFFKQTNKKKSTSSSSTRNPSAPSPIKNLKKNHFFSSKENPPLSGLVSRYALWKKSR